MESLNEVERYITMQILRSEIPIRFKEPFEKFLGLLKLA